MARPVVWTAVSDEDVTAALAVLGVEYVLMDKRKLPDLARAQLPIASRSSQQACATLYEDGRYRLCRFVLQSGSARSGSRSRGGD